MLFAGIIPQAVKRSLRHPSGRPNQGLPPTGTFYTFVGNWLATVQDAAKLAQPKKVKTPKTPKDALKIKATDQENLPSDTPSATPAGTTETGSLPVSTATDTNNAADTTPTGIPNVVIANTNHPSSTPSDPASSDTPDNQA